MILLLFSLAAPQTRKEGVLDDVLASLAVLRAEIAAFKTHTTISAPLAPYQSSRQYLSGQNESAGMETEKGGAAMLNRPKEIVGVEISEVGESSLDYRDAQVCEPLSLPVWPYMSISPELVLLIIGSFSSVIQSIAVNVAVLLSTIF